MPIPNQIKPLIFLVTILIVVSLACSGGANTQAPSSNGQDLSPQTTVTKQVTTPRPSSTPRSTNTPRPTATATPMPFGLSRSNPFSKSELIPVPNWDIQVLEIKRGEAAWNDINAANQFNVPAPEGMEYFLIKLHVKSTYTDNEEHTINRCDFSVTGDRSILYTCAMALVVEPSPQLDATVFTGGEAEGWVAFMVAQGEGNLILVVDEGINFDDNSIRYIALDDSASISISPELASIKPNNLGRERNTPAPFKEKVITDDWELSVVQVVRGDDALKMVKDANQFNEPPNVGMEYVALKLHVRYIGTTDKAERIGSGFFKSTGSANVLYDMPIVVNPSPALEVELFPDGEYEGWVVVQAAINETGMNLVFQPLFDFSGDGTRYLSIE